MENQILPSSLREAMSEAYERLAARVALLRYLDALPFEKHAADHEVFCAQLRSERDELAYLVEQVVNAWRAGCISIVAASHALRCASVFVRR